LTKPKIEYIIYTYTEILGTQNGYNETRKSKKV
jgi:hypothetical protein